jgi:hypothetical protein
MSRPRRHVSFACLLLAVLLAASPAVAQPSEPKVLDKTFGQWSALWWQWAYSIPKSSNPMIDPTGAFCDVGQEGPVWFLAGVLWGGTAERTCTIPQGKYILFPIANSAWVNSVWDDPNNTEWDYRQYANDFLGPALGGDLEATLDGVPVVFNPKTPIVRSQSPIFTAVFPFDNIFDADPAGLSDFPAVSDGWWVMLPPLSPGPHELRFRAGTAQQVIYHLTALGPPPPHALKITVGPAGTPNPSNAAQPVTLTVTAVDTHGHPLQYLWQEVCAETSRPGRFGPNANVPAPTWTPPTSITPLTCLIRLLVIDDQGASATASFVQSVRGTP